MEKLKTTPIASVAFVLVALVVIALFVPTPKHTRLPVTPTQAPRDTREPSHTVEKMQSFFDTHLAPLLLETFTRRVYSIPEIQERYDILTRMIRERYGKEYALDPRGVYWPTSKQMLVAAHIENSVPQYRDTSTVGHGLAGS